jgi:hypothetical protein
VAAVQRDLTNLLRDRRSSAPYVKRALELYGRNHTREQAELEVAETIRSALSR